MTPSDHKDFGVLIAGIYAYHRQHITPALIEMYWRGCQRWGMEQVQRAIDQLTYDPEAGRFAPKLGDIARVLEGTATDRASIAWGKVHEAIGSVGAYTDVVFDDPAIHACVDDLGGWPKVCRTELKDLGYLQHRFCDSHRAYVGRGTFEFPRRLTGDRSPDSEYAKRGLKPPAPALIGHVEACLRVYRGGSASGKTAITYQPIESLALLEAA